MIEPKVFFEELKKNNVDFFTGVPDSYLNGFCRYIRNNVPYTNNVVTANEGNSIAVAAGYYIATKKIPLVYMQNSGYGNALNPLASLADENVYSIPMILLIGWRGEPGTNDWDQHKLQGRITGKLLEIMNIPYAVVRNEDINIADTVQWAAKTAREKRKAVAIVVCKGVLSGMKDENYVKDYPMSREKAMEIVIETMPEDTIYIASTGRATRELYYLREKRAEKHCKDFLNVGAMGHASSVALGIAMQQKTRKVVCFDCDAAAIMHMGCFTMARTYNAPNLIHIVLNNGAHESVGGQPSAGQVIEFTKIASGAGYATIGREVTDENELTEALNKLSGVQAMSFIDVRIHKGMERKVPPLKISYKNAGDNLIAELNKRGRE